MIVCIDRMIFIFILAFYLTPWDEKEWPKYKPANEWKRISDKMLGLRGIKVSFVQLLCVLLRKAGVWYGKWGHFWVSYHKDQFWVPFASCEMVDNILSFTETISSSIKEG